MSRESGTYAIFNTSEGTIVCRLFEKDAPNTVKNFVELAEGKREWTHPVGNKKSTSKLYDGTIFHRVIPDFMIQGGDPMGTGMGDPGFTIADEFVPSLKFDIPGRLAMANVGQPHTGGCQFFITEVPTPHLNGKHTIFGQVVEGQDVVTKIVHVPAKGDKPITPVKIVSIVIKREGPAPGDAAKKAAVKKAAPKKQ